MAVGAAEGRGVASMSPSAAMAASRSARPWPEEEEEEEALPQAQEEEEEALPQAQEQEDHTLSAHTPASRRASAGWHGLTRGPCGFLAVLAGAECQVHSSELLTSKLGAFLMLQYWIRS